MIKKSITILLISIILISCHSKRYEYKYARETFESCLDLKLPEEFTIIKFDNSISIGDYIETITIKLSDDDFKSIILKMSQKNILNKSPKKDCLYFNIEISEYELISIIFIPETSTIKYTLRSE